MRIHSLSTLLAIPFIIWMGYLLYALFYIKEVNTVWAIIPAVILCGIYVSYPQIDFWWLSKTTPPLDQKMKDWLIRYMPYYNRLDDDSKTIFEQRLVLYVDVREFKSVGTSEMKDVPYDIKSIIASQNIRMLLGLDDYLLKDMDRIYLYKHPFPSPNHQFLHTVETNTEDGIIIFSLEQGVNGILNPGQHYNVVLHGYAEAFVENFPDLNYPEVEHYGWQRLELIEGVFGKRILSTIGFTSTNLLPVHIVAFFEFSDQYEKLFPSEFIVFTDIFKQNPFLNKIIQ
jgi:hypothetical protein